MSHQVTPGESNRFLYGNDAVLKTLWEIPGEPFSQRVAFSPVVHQGNPSTDLCNRHGTDEGAIFIKPIQPLQNTGFRKRFCHLGQYIGIEQQSHSGRSRSSSR